MVLAAHLGQRIAHRRQEVLVGGDDGAVQLELDHRLGLANGHDLAGVVGGLMHLPGDVGGVLDHLVGFAVGVENRVVAGLDPDRVAVLSLIHI